MPVDEEIEVGLGRIQENEKISNTLISSIYAGHLMFSGRDRQQVIEEFTDRISHIPKSNPPKTDSGPGVTDH